MCPCRMLKTTEKKEKTLEGKVLFIMGNMSTHPSVDVLNPINEEFKVMFLPPNVAPLIQPLDQGGHRKIEENAQETHAT